MLFEKIRDLTNTMLKQMSTASPAPKKTTKDVLDGTRSVILVTGASGKTGSCIMKEILSAGIASKVLAHVSPRTSAADMPKEWSDSKIVETISADLATIAGVDSVISAAKSAGVGSVVYAASGGVDNCETVENIALEKLIAGLKSQLAPDTVQLFDFTGSINGFQPLDDVIMGGRSSSSMVQDGTIGKFTGNVTTQGGGGFAQTRAALSTSLLAKEGAETINLSGYDGISIRVRGDGTPRNYKLNLKDDDISDFAFQAMFSVEGTAWKTLRIPFSAFIPMRRGVPEYSNVPGENVYASTLDVERVRTIGIVLSLVYAKVKLTEGKFCLDVSDISAYRNEAPRFVLCSSAAVTRPFWTESMRKSKGTKVTDIPIVKLNPGKR